MSIELLIDDVSEKVEANINEGFINGGSSDYNKLKNKPTLNGITIEGNMNETDPTVPDWAKAETRPVYTADDVGALKEDDMTSVSIAELDELWNSIE